MPDNWMWWAGGLALVYWAWKNGWLGNLAAKLPVAGDPVAAAWKVIREEAEKKEAKEREVKQLEAVRSALK